MNVLIYLFWKGGGADSRRTFIIKRTNLKKIHILFKLVLLHAL